jgi:hypothetical protein
MSEVNARLVTIIQAIKHAIITSNAPGLSVNTHPNPYMLNVIGTIDLQRAAEEITKQLGAFDAHAAALAKKEADAETAASVVDGH